MVSEYKSTLPKTFKDGTRLWFPADSITYAFIPLEWRVIWVDVVEIVWVLIQANGNAQADLETKNKIKKLVAEK